MNATSSNRLPGAGDPYCGACGYDLRQVTDSAVCPECGGRLIDVMRRKGDPSARTIRRRSQATILGVPVLSIAFGPDLTKGERRGHARGIIAIGDTATGGIAIGGVALGVVSVGGCSFGIAGIGGLAVGLGAAMGGGAVGGLAVGGGAAGYMATGGGAIGYYAQGGGAYGHFARGGGAHGTHVISSQSGVKDQAAVDAFKSVEVVMGTSNPGKSWINTPAMWVGAAWVTLAVVVGALACIGLARGRSARDDAALRFGHTGGGARVGQR